jgi:sodium transport system permease protein
MLADFPQLQKLLESPQSFARDHEIWRTGSRHLFAALLVFAVLPAIGEELAFRGFILNGLRKRYRARTTVFLSAFMGAFFHMNVFAFIPVFLIGLVLGLLTIRSRSIVPAMLFHFCSKAALLLSEPLARILAEPAETVWTIALLPVAIVCCAIIFSICVWLYRRKLPD